MTMEKAVRSARLSVRASAILYFIWRALLMLGMLLLMVRLATCQQLPDNPQPQKTPNFFTFRTSWRNPPLRSNRATLHSKTFWLLHGAYVAAVIVDIRVTHGKREDATSEIPPIPAIVALDYLADRFFSRALAVEAPAYAIVHYSLDAAR